MGKDYASQKGRTMNFIDDDWDYASPWYEEDHDYPWDDPFDDYEEETEDNPMEGNFD
jgi:hypothetical protein